METNQECDLSGQDKPMPRAAMYALIGKNVLRSLGSPVDMLKVKVNSVVGDHYRVNVMVGKNAGSGSGSRQFLSDRRRSG